MASDFSSQPSKPAMTAHELIAFVRKELDTDEERQAKIALAGEDGGAVVPDKAHSGHTLDLSHKNIGALPVEVVLLIKERVERLALSHNPRIHLPLEISQCDKLRYLNLRWNKLRKFPEAVLSLSKLEILDISKNAIDGIPEEIKNMTNLKFLAVARNQIRRLPLALGEMNLVKLKFDENPIEFPPAEALKPSSDRAANMIDSEKDKDMCQQVKKFMRASALRAKMRTNSEEDLSSESQESTPRPPRRGITGTRFPVRPSISSMAEIAPNMTSLDSPPDGPPPLPQKSHARDVLSNVMNPMKRPGVAPILTSNDDAGRSRSESVATTADIRNRRQGYVPRKNMNQREMSAQLSARSTQTPALTPPHSRAPSVTSNNSNYLVVGSGGESSSGAVSPVDGLAARANLSRRLASLPESRNSRSPTVISIKAVKRVLYMLLYLYSPFSDIVQQLKRGTPKRSHLERALNTADAQVKELGRLLNKANNTVEDNAEIAPAMLAGITRAAIHALHQYARVVQELSKAAQQAIKQVDPFHMRCLITTAYSTIVEARNLCTMLGFKTKPKPIPDTVRASQAWSSRTVTPTQPKSANSTRRRGATILPSGGSVASSRGMAPPVPLHAGSRSNTMTSISTAATPRYNASFTDLQSQNGGPSRSDTMRSVMSESETEETPDQVYLKLKQCCDLAHQTLPPVRAELLQRRTDANNAGHTHAAHQYEQAITRCNLAIGINNGLLDRLRMMRVGDTVRHAKDFVQMTESLGQGWANFVTEVSSLRENGIDVGNMRKSLRPLQTAIKSANNAASHVARTIPKPLPSASLQGRFPQQLSTNILQHAGSIPPVPATPLGAALGPAVQATVAPTPTTSFHSPESGIPYNPFRRPTLTERSNTTLPLPSYPRR